jgi:hypothetical protein
MTMPYEETDVMLSMGSHRSGLCRWINDREDKMPANSHEFRVIAYLVEGLYSSEASWDDAQCKLPVSPRVFAHRVLSIGI